MRNLSVYPITHGEACSALQESQKDYYDKYSDNIGGTRGLSLLYTEMFIRENKELFNEFTKRNLPGMLKNE